MKIGIICAMEAEAKLIISAYNLSKINDDYFEVFVNSNKSIILLISKIGKIYAGMGTQWLIINYNVNMIINIGLAGAIKTNFPIGGVFLAKQVIQHDGYLPWEDKHLNYFTKSIDLFTTLKKNNLDNENLGIVLTGDQFINDQKKSIELAKIGDIVEMEAFAVASVCLVFEVSCIIIKAISDNATEVAQQDFTQNIELAMKNSLPVLEKVIAAFKEF